MTEKNQFYSLNGNVRMAKYDTNGVLGKFWNVGNVSSFELSIEEDIVEERETQTGNRLVAATINNGITSTLNTVLKELSRENIEAVIRGKSGNIATATITAAPIALTFAEYSAGITEVVLPHLKLSSIVVEDALAATITVGTNGADFGVIALPAGLVTGQFPLEVSYTSGTVDSIGFMTQQGATYAIRLEGINTVTGGANHKMFVEFYKASISPAQSLELLAADAAVTEVPVEIKILSDSSKTPSDSLGQLGRIVVL